MQHAAVVGHDLHIHIGTVDFSCAKAPVGKAEQLLNGPQHGDQGGQEVGGHIQHRAAALFVKEARVGVPQVGAGAHVVGRHADDLPDLAVIDQLPDSLELRGQEGVRGAAHKQALFFRKSHNLMGLLQAGSQRFLAVDVLAGLQGLHGQTVVGAGVGENQDNVHRRVCQHLLRGVDLGDVPALCRRLGCFRVQIRAAHRAYILVHRAQVAQIGIAEGAAADHAQAANFVSHCSSLQY